MSKENLTENQTEIDEPMSNEESFTNLLQDLVSGNSPSIWASEFIEEFVLRDRPEAAQVTSMLEMPTENLVEMVKGVIEQSYQAQLQAVDERGHGFLDGLKAEVKNQMTELANG